MEKQLRIGDLVVALKEIRELDPLVDIVHARPGDLGMVIGLEDRGCPMVRFCADDGKGSTATNCYCDSEITLLRVADMTVGAQARA